MATKKVPPVMNPSHILENSHVFLLLLQVIILFFIKISIGTLMVWFWSAVAVIPPLAVVFKCSHKKIVLLSLLLFFISGHLIYGLSQPEYSFSYGGDTIRDFHVATVLYNETHFDFGSIGYAEQSEQYSDYPMVHLFSVLCAKVTGVSLYTVCRFAVPFINAVLVCYCFFYILQLLGVCPRNSGLVTIVYGTLFYLNFKHGQFVRETFAFPFVLLSLLYVVKTQKGDINRIQGVLLVAVFSTVTFLSHHFSSYMLVVLVGLFIGCEILKHPSTHGSRWWIVIVATGGIAVFLYRSDYFMFHITATLTNITSAFSSFFQGGPPAAEVMTGYSLWRTVCAVSYFAVVLIFSVVGWSIVLWRGSFREKILTTFFLCLFGISIVLRAYAPVHTFSWGYSLAKRSTIWSFIGLSYLLVKGTDIFSRKIPVRVPVTALIILWLGISSFAPYPEVVTDFSREPPITYERYVSSVWLQHNSIHRHNLAVPSRRHDTEYFEIARNMATYAYLREYHLTWASFEEFSGHVPIVHGRALGEDTVEGLDTIYDNGTTALAFKWPEKEQ